MQKMLMLLITACITAWVPSGIKEIQSKLKPQLSLKLPVFTRVKSNVDVSVIQTLVDTNLAYKNYVVLNKNNFTTALRSTNELIAKNASTPGFSIFNLPPAIQFLDIHTSQTVANRLDSLNYRIILFPASSDKRIPFEVIPDNYLAGKTPIQAMMSLMDSLALPRAGRIIF